MQGYYILRLIKVIIQLEREIDHKSVNICDECGSEYYSHASKMANLCPECSHFLYGYENCKHDFQNGRCVKCYWNGNISAHLKKTVNDDHDTLSRNMQNEVIKIATERLGDILPDELIAKVRQNRWSYMGLEMMIDTVKTIEVSEIKNYLSKLD